MKRWQPRTKAPTTSDLYYLRKDKGGYNSFTTYNMFENGGNCTSYAFGRFMEVGSVRAKGIVQKTCNLPLGNAEDWFAACKDYEKGQKPRHGAVACWSNGATWDGTDGAGHVAIVEDFDDDYIYVTESNWKRTLWREAKYPIFYGKPYIAGYKFEGFIYNPWEENNWVEDTIEVFKEYKCIITSTTGLNCRKGPSTSQPKVLAYNFGQTVTISAVSNGWGKTPDGWILLKHTKKLAL